MASFLAAAYGATLLTATGQWLLKQGVDRAKGQPLLAIYANPHSLAGYAILALATLAALYAYSVLPLKYAAVVMPFNYLFVGVFAYAGLGERLARRQWLGALIILAGIVVFNS